MPLDNSTRMMGASGGGVTVWGLRISVDDEIRTHAGKAQRIRDPV